ncbi:MAG TPA: GspE/PulE family protein [Phycisphaerae bacterium]|nr:GspE/PulE family protein [Phycisphaerae bacterium]
MRGRHQSSEVVATAEPAAHVEAVGSGAEASEFVWQPTDSTAARHGPERILVETGRITPEQLQAAALRQQETPRLSLLDVLVQFHVIEEVEALQAVALYFRLPFARLQTADIDLGVFSLLPVEYLKDKGILPIRRIENGYQLAVSDPADIFLIDDIKRRLEGRIQLIVSPPADVRRVIEELSADPIAQVDEIIKGIAEDAVEVVDSKSEDVADLEMLAGESPVIRYVNFLISIAVKEGASDIHIEPGENRLRVRCRIDGVLFDQQAPPAKMHAAIISRLKIMANLDIAERRLPQDGRIRATVHGRTVDLRVSTLPVVHGEKCVIRILDARSTMVGMEKLGFAPDTLAAFKEQILQPHGIVLVTGPTGSGKSTTLYSGLRIMDGDRLNISTVEDPVEYELDFCNQVNVHESIGMTFSAALRSLLRQDPDVIMIGEIRDPETARIAIQASLTGHMVLSTLHTNDAPSSVTRLINIGVEPFLISAAVNAIIAQRLVRRICPNCKEPQGEVKATIAKYMERYGADPKQLYRGAGCEKCRQTGYKGRLGVYELLVVNEEIKDMISRGPTLNEMRAAAKRAGMRNLGEDGVMKAAAGLTTVEELMRVIEV